MVDEKYGFDTQLKDKLYALRTKIAKDNNIYTENNIYTYETMKQVAKYYPTNVFELVSIKNIGNISEDYGQAIVDVVNEHIKENNIDVQKYKYLNNKQDTDYDIDLYNILVKEISNINEENKIYPSSYLLLPEYTIKNICRKYPKSKEELIFINGIGIKRYELYGEKILKNVNDYIIANEEKVHKNLDLFTKNLNREMEDFTYTSKVLKGHVVTFVKKYPIVCNRISLLIQALYNLKNNIDKKDVVRLIAGGEIKTLIRNVIEPLANFAINPKTKKIEVISKIIKIPEYRMDLMTKYNISLEELEYINILYNYSNGCDHILDAENKLEKIKIEDYIKNFEKLNIEAKNELLTGIYRLIDKIIIHEDVIKKMENLFSDLVMHKN